MDTYRGFIVWIAGIVVVLGTFMIFVAAGWPGEPDSCVDDSPNTCFCEAYDIAAVQNNEGGVRQPVNTWFNLYSIATSFIVAAVVYVDRVALGSKAYPNLMKSKTAVPDLYIFAILFLGLGSMWFHASLTAWGGVLDGVSMYIFTAFLIAYSIRRMWDSAIFFWLFYAGIVLLFSALHAFTDIPSFVNILILIAGYVVVEIIIWVRSGKVLQGKVGPILLWSFGVLSILTATFFWWASQTDRFMCDPNSFFQPHGLFWHPLAGVAGVLVYFYWRAADDPV